MKQTGKKDLKKQTTPTKKPVKKTKAAVKKPAVKERGNSEKPAKKVRGRPFPKGVSGNPKGRPPKGETLTDALKAVIDEDGKTLVAEKLLTMALGKGRQKPYFPALKYLFDRIDGEPIKAIQAAVETSDLSIVKLAAKEFSVEELECPKK
jgi:hypothetical protein